MNVELRSAGIRSSTVVGSTLDLATVIECHVVDDKTARDVMNGFTIANVRPIAAISRMRWAGFSNTAVFL